MKAPQLCRLDLTLYLLLLGVGTCLSFTSVATSIEAATRLTRARQTYSVVDQHHHQRSCSHLKAEATTSTESESIAPEITSSQVKDVEELLSRIYGASDQKEYESRRSEARLLTQQQIQQSSPSASATSTHDSNNTIISTSTSNTLPEDSSLLASIPDHELVYGELGVGPLVQILNAVGVHERDEHFSDIGSGHGMLVLAAALLFPNWQSSRGLEIVPHLHDQAVQYQLELETFLAAKQLDDGSKKSALNSAAAPMELSLGNIYEPSPELSSIFKQTTSAVCFATTWSQGEQQQGRRLLKLSHALRSGVLAPHARIIVIDGHLLPHDGHVYQGELWIQCPDTVPYSTAYLYTYNKEDI